MLKPPTPGLHRLHNKSKDVAKVALSIGPYDELEVSDDLAAQLQAQSSALVEGGAPEWPEEWNDASKGLMSADEVRAVEDQPDVPKKTRAKKAAKTDG